MLVSLSAATARSLETDQAKNVAIVGIVVVVVVGLLLSWLVTKIIARVVVLIVAIVLAVVVYQQRSHVEDAASNAAKKCDVTFFGVHLTPSDPVVKQQCQKLANSNLPANK